MSTPSSLSSRLLQTISDFTAGTAIPLNATTLLLLDAAATAASSAPYNDGEPLQDIAFPAELAVAHTRDVTFAAAALLQLCRSSSACLRHREDRSEAHILLH
jgi:hypothetical protein